VAADIDWDALRTAAMEAATHAYAPYSHFYVGAAGLVDDGRIVRGCNVENASYGLALCAECGMVSALATSGGGRLVAVVTVAGDGQPVMPCGRCRQLLWEHGGPQCLVNGDGTPKPMRELLPGAFDDTSMEGRTPSEERGHQKGGAEQ
jgi:cytidine deaminase